MLLMQELCFKNFTTVVYQKRFLSVRKLDPRAFECKNPKVREGGTTATLSDSTPSRPLLDLDYYLCTLSGFFRILCSHPCCLFVCGQHYSKRYEWIGMKFYGGVLGSTMKK